MISVSLCMIVKNEEDVLERCLTSAAALADEIIIVDTGSTDRTKEIAARFTSLQRVLCTRFYGLLYVAGRGRCAFGGGPDRVPGA